MEEHVCLLKSHLAKKTEIDDYNNNHQIARAFGVGNINDQNNSKNGLSDYQNLFLNAGSTNSNKYKTILPGHNGQINDLMIFDDKTDFMILSASSDNTIK